MEPPKQIKPKTLADYLEVMSKVAFQSGMSWAIVENKWQGTRAAFRDFDPIKVASLTTKQIDALAEDSRIIRNRRKIEGVVHNARTMIELEEQHGSFRKYLRSQKGFEPLVKDMRKRFKFLGDFGAFYFLYVVSEPVPEYEVWCASRNRVPMGANRS
jgi:3-methyladenine DNA glycosylase Tag